MVNNVLIHAHFISGERVAKMCAIALIMHFVHQLMELASVQPVIMVKTVVSHVLVDSMEKTVQLNVTVTMEVNVMVKQGNVFVLQDGKVCFVRDHAQKTCMVKTVQSSAIA